jgi:hypothetical protein
MELLLIAALVLVGGLVIWKMSTRSAKPAAKRNKPRSLEALDTLQSWQPQATRILTTAERKAYLALRGGLPEHIILAQVPLARFVKVPTRHSYSEWLRRVGLLCADLVVCDSSSQVIAVVDIRAPEAQEKERTSQRHNRMDRVLEAAGIPLHVWREDALPSATGARNAILGSKSSESTPSTHAPSTTAGYQPVGRSQADEDDDGLEMREPPPSTWFDDIDSAPAPLAPAAPPANIPRSGSSPRIR